MTSGIHHITAITRKIQANVDFYAGFLGLRLVKRTAGYEDADQLHLFYGDAAASPGSLVTFLAWEDGSPGRVGLGQPAEIAFAIRPEKIRVSSARPQGAVNAMEGEIYDIAYLGDMTVYHVKLPDGRIVKASALNAARASDDPLTWNDRAWISFAADAGVVLAR